MSDIEFIKKFSNITVTRICKENGISKANLYRKKSMDKQWNKNYAYIIRKKIEDELRKLFEECDENG